MNNDGDLGGARHHLYSYVYVDIYTNISFSDLHDCNNTHAHIYVFYFSKLIIFYTVCNILMDEVNNLFFNCDEGKQS